MTRFVALVVVLASSALVGCSSAEPADEAELTQDAVSARFKLRDVAVVRLNSDAAVVGAPAKLKRVLDNLGLGESSAPLPETTKRCRAGYTIELFRADGEVAATGGFRCQGWRPDEGVLRSNGKAYLIRTQGLEALDAIGRESVAVGDLLYGIDRVVISTPGLAASAKETSDPELIGKLLGATERDEIADASAPRDRCMPARAVTFHRGGDEVAALSFSCSESERGRVRGYISSRAPEVGGVIGVDAGAVLEVENLISRVRSR